MSRHLGFRVHLGSWGPTAVVLALAPAYPGLSLATLLWLRVCWTLGVGYSSSLLHWPTQDGHLAASPVKSSLGWLGFVMRFVEQCVSCAVNLFFLLFVVRSLLVVCVRLLCLSCIVCSALLVMQGLYLVAHPVFWCTPLSSQLHDAGYAMRLLCISSASSLEIPS